MMNRQRLFWGCLSAGLIALCLLAAGGGWWYFRSRISKAEFQPESPVLVFLLAPTSGEEMEAGDLVPIRLQAVAPTAIQSAELFVDGQSLGVVTDSPQNAEWTWQAWPLGIHTLSARAIAADGQVGQSQTVIVNVLAGDGKMKVSAEEGQTLTQIGEGFGVPPDQMAGANPHVDPSQPLAGGQPVNVPVSAGNAGGGGSGAGSGQGGGAGAGSGQGQPPTGAGGPFFIPIVWNIKFTEPVDKSYCYVSSGDGNWEKMPKDPFHFFESTDSLYTQLLPPAENVVIQVDCWGWLGGVLKYLGQGKTGFDVHQMPQNVTLSGSGFQFVGIPQVPIQEETFAAGGLKTIPPPFALRFAEDSAECAAHANPLLAPFICNALLNAPGYNVLVWEWQPEVCWPGACKYGIDKVDGYRIYQLPDLTKKVLYSPKSAQYLKTVSDPQKVAAIPLLWPGTCYGVEAYVNDPFIPPSAMATFCPGQEPALQQITLTPTDWLTAGGTWIQVGDCITYPTGQHYEYENHIFGFGNQPGEIMIGSYIADDENKDCFLQKEYAGAVKFDLTHLILPEGAIIQKAELTYSTMDKDYRATGVATNWKPSCVSAVGRAKQDWTGLVSKTHFSSSSLRPYFAPYADLTWVVKDWLKNPASNYGLILLPAAAPDPQPPDEDWDERIDGRCYDKLGNFQLNIYYFAP
ncbi:MAG TPA: Ig-like domain-containing protein [Anaerolineales bacterium]|nr:Ig-like domain-containing protein [Anaerolineales bacterium]